MDAPSGDRIEVRYNLIIPNPKRRYLGVLTWLEVKWDRDGGWSGLSLEEGWIDLPNGPPIETLTRIL